MLNEGNFPQKTINVSIVSVEKNEFSFIHVFQILFPAVQIQKPLHNFYRGSRVKLLYGEKTQIGVHPRLAVSSLKLCISENWGYDVIMKLLGGLHVFRLNKHDVRENW